MKKIFNNKIILIFELVILIVLLFSCNKYAVSNMLDKGNEFIANEDKEYIPIHQNAEIQGKFNVYAQYILIVLVSINSLIFCFYTKKSNKIVFKYISSLIFILLFYIIAYNYVKYKYPSELAIIPIKLHSSIYIISISILLSLFIKSNKLRIIISSLPTILLFILGGINELLSYTSIEYFIEDLTSILASLIFIEILVQIILCPIYYLFKKKY